MLLKFFVSSYFVCIVSFLSPVFADTYTWSLKNAEEVLIGGTFATPENWTLSDGTTATEAPGVDDDVVIPSGTAAYTVTASSKFNVKSLTIGDNEGASATVTLTLNVKVNKDEFVGDVVEDIVVGTKGKITHTAVATTGTGLGTLGKTDYKLNLKAGRDITIKSGGSVNASNCGFKNGQGPYPGNQASGSYRGAAHGGIGNHRYYYNNNDIDKKPYIRTYGSIRNPSEPGAGGGKSDCRGGGVIFLSAEGILTVNGTISANASSSDNGAGGSIMLKGGSLAGSGSVTVTGGTGGSYKGGGGGRIAIYTAENKQFTDIPFCSNIKALGGYDGRSTCGTIYFQNGEHIDKRGEIIIDNNRTGKPSTTGGTYTYLNENITDIFEPFGKITVKGSISVVVAYAETKGVEAVNLMLANGLSVQAETKKSGKVTQEKSTLFTRDAKAGIHFVPESGTVFNFSGSITNHNFVCNAPGATLSFANNASMYISFYQGGKNVICGEPGNLLKLTSSTDTGSWTLYLREGASIDASYLDVSRGKASSSNKIVAKDSKGDDFSKANYWEFPASIKPGDPLTWTGASDTSWVNADNWEDQYGGKRLPEETDVITIPANCLIYPKLIAEQKVNKLFVAEGASINLSGANIIVTNTLTVAGDITRSTAEKLIVAGEGDAVLDFGNREYGDVVITKSGGTIVLPNGLKTKRLKITSSAATTFEMPAGKTIEADVLDIDGNNGDFANKLITIVSSTPGTKWNLKVNDVMRIRGVNVSDSDASLGRTIAAGEFASDEGNNVNWDFTSGSAAEWVGGTDSNWTTPENWLPEGVPGEATVVAIKPSSANVTVTLNPSDKTIVPMGGLMLGGSDSYSVTLTCNKAIEVNGGVDVDNKTTLLLNSYKVSNYVSGLFVVRNGATLSHSKHTGGAKAYAIDLYVKGDVLIDKGAVVNVNDCGPYNGGLGYSGALQNLPSHGGLGSSNTKSCYGSVFYPIQPGSAGAKTDSGWHYGGGAVKIIAEGDLTLRGNVTANASEGSGGSIWLSGSLIKGAGTISATGAGTYGAAGGRIALYQTGDGDFMHTGWVSASGSGDNTHHGGNGTIYYKTKSGGPYGGGGKIVIKGRNNKDSITVLPMSDDGDAKTAYENVTIEVINGTLRFSKATKVGELILNGGYLDVRDDLVVVSRKYKEGKGWTGTLSNVSIASGKTIRWGLLGLKIVIR